MTSQYNENYNGTMPFSDTDFQISCASEVEQTATVPGDITMQYQAFFSYNEVSNVFICLNALPVIPSSGSVGVQQYNEFRPEKRYVRGGDVLHFITPDTSGAYVGVSLRQLQG
jgi:hypothetical protein